MCTLTCGPLPFGSGWSGGAGGVVAGSRSPSRRATSPRVSVVEPAGDADDRARRLVPAVDVVEERLARCGADGLLAADDVPADRLVAVHQRVVHAADVVARRVEVHVHLLDDHALLALDLFGLELRVAQHVGEDVERDALVLGRAPDVVARVLLAGERVELAADAVDRHADVARGRPPVGSLEEHVLGEVRDAVRLLGLVAGARGEEDEDGRGGDLRQRGGQQAQAVVEGRAFEDGHQAARRSFHSGGSSTERACA